MLYNETNGYAYSQETAFMTDHNLQIVNRDIQKLTAELVALTNKIQQAASDVDAVSSKLVPSERFQPSTIHGQTYQQWFFNLTSIGNCHDCPLHEGQSSTSNDPERLPCGAHECIIRKLCRGAGLCR